MTDKKIKEHITNKFVDENKDDDDFTFDLHYYVNSEFYAEDKPNVLYLFDGDLDEDLLTNTKYSWVQFAKDTQSKLIGVELRGRGKSTIEGQDLKNSSFFTIAHHLSDLNSIDEYTGYEFGPAPWLLVGRGYSGELAIWSRLSSMSEFTSVLAFDVDTNNLSERDGTPFAKYNPSNIILVGSDDSKLEEYKKFTENINKSSSEIAILAEKDKDQIVEQLKKFTLSKLEDS